MADQADGHPKHDDENRTRFRAGHSSAFQIVTAQFHFQLHCVAAFMHHVRARHANQSARQFQSAARSHVARHLDVHADGQQADLCSTEVTPVVSHVSCHCVPSKQENFTLATPLIISWSSTVRRRDRQKISHDAAIPNLCRSRPRPRNPFNS
jgi:hypothetical protein